MKKIEPKELQDLLRENMRRAINSSGLNNAQVAEKMDVEPSSLSRALSGNRGVGLDFILKISNALDRPIEFFFTKNIVNKDQVASRDFNQFNIGKADSSTNTINTGSDKSLSPVSTEINEILELMQNYCSLAEIKIIKNKLLKKKEDIADF